MKHLDLLIAILMNAAGYLAFKAISLRPHSLNWYLIFLLGLACGAVSTYCFTRALKIFPLSIAYPIFAAGTCILIYVLMSWLYKERINTAQICGMALAMGGIYLMTRA
jgi:multidrug transporter EmrE-like cation transporter